MNPHPRRWLILFVVLAAEIMDLLDGTIVNVALPTIKRHLHASDAALQWIAGGYALALAIGLVVGGRLGDRFGRRRMFLIGAAGFTVASTLSGLSGSTEMPVAFRLAEPPVAFPKGAVGLFYERAGVPVTGIDMSTLDDA